MRRNPPDVVHVGSASRDVTGDDPRGWRLGGAATYSALTTARLGLRTGALIGVDPVTGSAVELELLRAAGVDLVLAPLDEGPAFNNRETAAGRRQDCIAVGGPLRVANLPARWVDTPNWSLVPIADELDDDWAAAVPDDAFMSLGWQGLLRRLRAGHVVGRRPPGPSRLLRRANLVGVSLDDLVLGADPANLLAWLRPGATLVVTDGVYGGRLFRGLDDGVSIRSYSAITPDRDVDPTGAGDVFLAALLGGVIFGGANAASGVDAPDLDLPFAAAAASFVVEAPGLAGVPDLAAVRARRARDAASNGAGPTDAPAEAPRA